MNITFVKGCPPIAASGHSAYNAGDEATLKNGAALVASGFARKGWGVMGDTLSAETVEPSTHTPPDLSPTRTVLASKAVRKKAADNNLLIYSVIGTGKNGRVTMADVEALLTDD